jgi:hypothetical protein
MVGDPHGAQRIAGHQLDLLVRARADDEDGAEPGVVLGDESK